MVANILKNVDVGELDIKHISFSSGNLHFRRKFECFCKAVANKLENVGGREHKTYKFCLGNLRFVARGDQTS